MLAGRVVAPEWLRARAARAADAWRASPRPTTELPEWQYGRVDELDLAGYDAAAAPVASLDAAAEAARFLAGFEDATLVRVSPSGVEIEVLPQAAAAGLVVARARDLEVAPRAYGTLLDEVAHAFTHLAEAAVTDAVVIEVPDRAVIAAPIVIVHELGEGAGEIVAPRTCVRLGREAEADVVELLVSGHGPMLALPATELVVEDGAHLAYHAVQQLGRATWQLGCQASHLSRDAELVSLVAALGGDYARLETHSAALGTGSSSELDAIYLADGHQVQDLRTFQEHVAGQTRSNLVFKGAVADEARSVYTGLIKMHKGAKRADAAQTNRNLVLSEGARAFSVPNLDIEENDVRCAHATAVGPIDEEQRFYLESRGISPQVARRLILLGFFEDLLGATRSRAVAEYLFEVVTARLLAADERQLEGAS